MLNQKYNWVCSGKRRGDLKGLDGRKTAKPVLLQKSGNWPKYILIK